VHSDSPSHRRRHALRWAALTAVVAVVLSGCSATVQRGWLPGVAPGETPITNMTERITSLWVGSWIAALAVGVITWGLILWCVAVYRKRKSDETLPVQLRYHVPLEIMYVILPILMVGVLFYYTARDMSAITDRSAKPDLTIEVIGKQWSWDFNYRGPDLDDTSDDVYDTGQHAKDVGRNGVLADQVTLYLPVGKRVQFELRSRDVNHSFWIPAFLYKLDVIPGRDNAFQVVPMREGDYLGKCAEFCGEEHSGMLFNVKVVSPEEYQAHLQDLRDRGQTGSLSVELSRHQDLRSQTEGTGGTD